MKRKAYDSAIIYFKDVIKLHPAARKTRDAYLALHEAYLTINYKDDARDLCDSMRKAYPTDREVMRECGSAPAPVATK
jgi:outer membrane protein assembly factor BamD (BamD/ComL family)